jgi:flagellar hook-basal body complex protein FliE
MAVDPAALRAYAAAAQAAVQSGGAPDAASTAQTVDFSAMVTEAVETTQAKLRNAEALSAQGAAGQAELVDVVTAMAAAELQLETVVSVRDQVIRAYNEIIRMPI